MAEDHGAEPVGCGTKGEAHAKLNKLIMPAGKPRRVLRPRKVVI